MVGFLMNFDGLERIFFWGSGYSLIKEYPGIMEGLRKTTKTALRVAIVMGRFKPRTL
jgi:hypothetical protein